MGEAAAGEVALLTLEAALDSGERVLADAGVICDPPVVLDPELVEDIWEAEPAPGVALPMSTGKPSALHESMPTKLDSVSTLPRRLCSIFQPTLNEPVQTTFDTEVLEGFWHTCTTPATEEAGQVNVVVSYIGPFWKLGAYLLAASNTSRLQAHS